MIPDRKSPETIFGEAIAIESPEDRAAFLDQACQDDPELRRELEKLVADHFRAGDFLEHPVATIDMPPVAERPGQTIGNYKLLEEIGEGGMGVVYMAEQQEPVRRKVALKIIKPGMDTRQVVARFEAERQALALMDHPNIAKVFDGGTTASGRPYFVMELVKGVPITRYCDEQRLTPRERLELFVQVCHAVQHAHQKGIIHRDLKPSNVMVTLYDGVPVPKIIDFGVAKATGGQLTEKTVFTGYGQMIGTLEYMSPEQARLDQLDIDTRSDIYSLGVVLYELLSGQTPFDRQRLRSAAFDEMLRIIREEEPPKPSTRLSESKDALPSISVQRQMEPAKLTKLVRGELDWIVMKALEKDRNRRYETANGFALDIERYLADEPVEACPPSVAYRFRKFVRRNKAGLGVVALVLFFLILLGAGVGWMLRDREARREETAQQARESLSQARKWIGENKLALARQELAAAKARMGSDRAALGGLVEEIEAFEVEVAQYERFLDLVEQAHEAEFPQPVALALQAESAGGREVAPPQASSPVREPAKAVPFLLQAMSCYGVLERDNWSVRLEGGLLEPDQVARVRRAAYEELVWLADDVARRSVDHRSGRKASPQEAAEGGLAYLRQAEAAARPTAAFYLIRARLLNALGKQAEARQDEELARQTPATVALDHFLLALAAYDARNKAEAVKQYEAALRVEPTHYWSLLNLGVCLCNLGQQEQDFALAAAAYTGCILKRPDHAFAYAGRGSAYFRSQRYKEAEAEFREALRLRPDDPDARNNLGAALLYQRRYAEAEAELRQALRLRPDYPLAHCNLGAVLENGQGKHAEAEAEFREALRLRPDYPLAHRNLGVFLAHQGKYLQAEGEYREALRLRPDDPEAHIVQTNLCNALFSQGKRAEAEAEAREAVRLRPDSPGVRGTLGCTLFRLGKYAEAEAEWREALRLRPDYPFAHLNLGCALGEQRKYVEAEAEFREALRLRPDFSEAYYNLGYALAGQAKHAEAEAEYREALRLRPDYALAASNLGLVLREQGKPRAAARFYTEAVAAVPKLADDLDSQNRYNAACYAALAGCGQGDAAKLDDGERARLRGQALTWLRAELAAWGERVEKEPDNARAVVEQKLRYWQQDADFAGVRGDALAKLPEAERHAWQQLWADVEALRLRPDDPEARAKLAGALAKAYEPSPHPERLLAILTDLIASAPEDPRLDELLWERGEVALRLARWKEAETDFIKAIERSSDKHYRRFFTASVCLLAGDEEGYRRLCRGMLAESRWQQDPQIAAEMAKACLILPVADADLAGAVRLAKEAINPRADWKWNLLSQGIVDCRTGAYAAAAERLNQVIEKNASDREDALDALAHLFLAMAHQGQGHEDEAKKHLDAGRQLVLEEARGFRKRGFRVPWWDWTTAFVIYPQAVSRVEGTPESKARSQLDAEIDASGK